MTRQQLARMLERLQQEGELTAEEAVAILDAFDAGVITSDDLPAVGQEARPDLTEELLLAILIGLAQFAGSDETAAAVTQALGAMDLGELRATYEATRDASDARLAANGRAIGSGSVSVADWHRQMAGDVTRFVAQSAMIGAGGLLTPDERAALQVDLDEQMGYLRRYAEQTAARNALAETGLDETAPYSEAQHENRTVQYATVGIAAFWNGWQSLPGEGLVIYYRSQDDDGTCSPCLDADLSGPYLPGNAPLPGVTCLANGKCRCILEPVTDPQLAAAL